MAGKKIVKKGLKKKERDTQCEITWLLEEVQSKRKKKEDKKSGVK